MKVVRNELVESLPLDEVPRAAPAAAFHRIGGARLEAGAVGHVIHRVWPDLIGTSGLDAKAATDKQLLKLQMKNLTEENDLLTLENGMIAKQAAADAKSATLSGSKLALDMAMHSAARAKLTDDLQETPAAREHHITLTWGGESGGGREVSGGLRVFVASKSKVVALEEKLASVQMKLEEQLTQNVSHSDSVLRAIMKSTATGSSQTETEIVELHEPKKNMLTREDARAETSTAELNMRTRLTEATPGVLNIITNVYADKAPPLPLPLSDN
ncbi:hypothetical protein T484DRAFT_1839676 [Baffinella frigidus]|nr:hypothetical protein T484DRAFT_1839676 [Cryptophyta sp. CCMP2293]